MRALELSAHHLQMPGLRDACALEACTRITCL
jgi:hypothetical protein